MKKVTDEILVAIDSFIENNKDSIINDLMNLVRIPSVRSCAKDGAPFGEECKVMLEETAKLYERNGFKTRFDKNNNYIISNFNNGEKTIGIFSHGDVVPADGEWLMCSPFEPIIKNEYMYGRGCNDDKSGIIQALYAAKFIKENIKDFKSSILMYTGANEETGMADIKEFVKNETIPDFSLAPDGEYPFYCGERTIIRFLATANNSFKAIKNFCGGTAENIVLCEATATITNNENLYNELNELCKNSNDYAIKLNDGDIIITAFGIAAHAANVGDGKNAAKMLCDLLLKCNTLPCQDKEILSTASKFIADGYGCGFNIENVDKNFGKLNCCNGIASCKDNKLSLTFDIRAGIDYDYKDIESNILKACDEANFNVIFTNSSKGYIRSENEFSNAICDVFNNFVKKESGKRPILTAGGTYSRMLENSYSIGTVVYTDAPYIELPSGHGSVHQPDERLYVNGFLAAIKILISIIIEADNILNS